MIEVSGNLESLLELAEHRDVPLHPDLLPYVEKSGPFGKMLRHPLIYDMFLGLPGLTNHGYLRKRELLAEAVAAHDWHTAVFLYERPYRLRALIDYCTGRDEDGSILPLVLSMEHWDLAASVWTDSENIEQVIEDWRALFDQDSVWSSPPLWLGSESERAEFDALPVLDLSTGPHIRAWRGGVVGDWSWTTDRKIAQFFSRRSGYPVRGHLIPVADVFGYLTRRGEAELLVKYTDKRESLVYPDKYPRTVW